MQQTSKIGLQDGVKWDEKRNSVRLEVDHTTNRYMLKAESTEEKNFT